MSFPTQAAARCCRQLSGSVRPSSLRIATSATYLTARRTPSSRRWESTEAAPAGAAPTNPKIAQIVDQISTLTLLETADLVSSLKVRLISFFSFLVDFIGNWARRYRICDIYLFSTLGIFNCSVQCCTEPLLTNLPTDPPEHPRPPRWRLRHGCRWWRPRSRCSR
jgi:hypothetical protein